MRRQIRGTGSGAFLCQLLARHNLFCLRTRSANAAACPLRHRLSGTPSLRHFMPPRFSLRRAPDRSDWCNQNYRAVSCSPAQLSAFIGCAFSSGTGSISASGPGVSIVPAPAICLCLLIRRYLSRPEGRFESGGQSPGARVSLRMRTLRVDSNVLDGAHESCA